MPIGNPVTLTSNVASKAISVTATASQTLFNVTGGYRINELGVFKNGLRLQDGVDYTARDGLTVTLLSAASGGDKLQFVVFDTFRVAEAIRPSVDEQTIRGNLNVVGILSCTDLEGPVSLNITSGIQTFHDVRVGGALTVTGALTFDDVTNVDSVGYATFRSGINVQGAGSTTTTLNVTGVSTFGGIVSIGDSIFHTGDTNSAFGFPAADTFTVYTAGSERLRIKSDSQLLHTRSDDTTRYDLEFRNTGSINDDNYGGIHWTQASDGSTNLAAIEIAYRSSGRPDIVFKTRDSGETSISEVLRIDSDGDVGIGTTNPTFSNGSGLEVARTGTACVRIEGNSGNHALEAYADSDGATLDARGTSANLMFDTGGTERLRVTSAGLVGIGTAEGSSGSTRLVVYEESGNAQTIEIKAKNTGGPGAQPGIRFTAPNNDNIGAIYGDVNSDSLKLATGGSERISINDSGFIGVNETTPLNRVHIIGADHQIRIEDSANGNNVQIQVDGPGDNFNLDWVSSQDRNINLINSSSGGISVGVGTTVPKYRIDTGMGDAGIGTIRFRSTINGEAVIRVGSENSDVNLIRVDGKGDAGGNVGETDDAAFGFGIRYMGSRSGNNNSLSIFSDNSTSTEIEAVTVLQNGFVGVNQATPTSRLHVVGDVLVSGITTATQLFEGSTRVATSGKAIAMALIFG